MYILIFETKYKVYQIQDTWTIIYYDSILDLNSPFYLCMDPETIFFMFELCIFKIFFMNNVSCANPFSLYICGKQKLISISYKAWVRHLCEFYCKFIKHHSYCKYFHLLSINLHIHQICFYIALKLSPVTNRKLFNIMSIFFKL